ncbi:MAG: hypothetical protein H6703_14840 [Myxococcales bacterium]|nr:hypothetical protein [Myxococcales bacterium]
MPDAIDARLGLMAADMRVPVEVQVDGLRRPDVFGQDALRATGVRLLGG